VILVCRPQLVGILAETPGADRVIGCNIGDVGKKIQLDYDLWTTPMCLPLIFNTTAATIPADVPYLLPKAEKVRQWQATLTLPPPSGRGLGTKKIGVVWAGSPTYARDKQRSCAIEHFLKLAEDVPECRFYALQKGEAAHQLAADDSRLIKLSDKIEDFTDTAAILSCLDLIISVDTAVAHLAGMMARPVWTLLPYRADWRWQEDREDTDWYPSMRLFRQQALDDWDGVFEHVKKALRAP
jgi:hypothetical protein